MNLQTHRFKNTLKEFDTLAISCQYLNDGDKKNPVPMSLEGIEIKAHANSKTGKLVDKLRVTVLDNKAGIFMLEPTLKRLPVGTLEIDICMIKDSAVVTSETFSLNVKKSETNPYL